MSAHDLGPQKRHGGHHQAPDDGDPVAAWDRERAAEQRALAAAFSQTRSQFDDKRTPHWTPWLLIRYTPNDLGLRPIPAGDVFWASPDIWVESSDPLGQAVAGEDNYVHARISNLGAADAAPVKVDFYWADPSLGLGPATMNLIGTEWLEIFSGGVQDVRCQTPWVPVVVNGGHECLMVQCDNHVLDPLRQPFQPTLDRHVGQHNTHVVQAAAGEPIHFGLLVTNLFPIEARTTIAVRIEHVAVTAAGHAMLRSRELIPYIAAFGGATTNTPQEMRERFVPGTAERASAPQVARLAAHREGQQTFVERAPTGAGQPSITASLAETSSVVMTDRPGSQLAQLLLARDKLSAAQCQPADREITLRQVLLRPFEQRRLDLELTAPASGKRGEYAVYHVTQQLEGMLVGGYTIITETSQRK